MSELGFDKSLNEGVRLSRSEQLYFEQVELADYGLAVDAEVLNTEWIAAPSKQRYDRFAGDVSIVGETSPMDIETSDIHRTPDNAGEAFLRTVPEKVNPITDMEFAVAQDIFIEGGMEIEEFRLICRRHAALHPVTKES